MEKKSIMEIAWISTGTFLVILGVYAVEISFLLSLIFFILTYFFSGISSCAKSQDEKELFVCGYIDWLVLGVGSLTFIIVLCLLFF